MLALSDVVTEAGSAHINRVRVGQPEGGRGGRGGREGNEERSRRRAKDKPWYDDACRRQRDVFREAQSRHSEIGSDATRVWRNMQRGIYRKLCRSKKREFLGKEALRLWGLGQTDPNAFWREVKGKKTREGLPDLNFFDHFRNLANKESSVDERGREEIRQENENDGGNVHIPVLDDPIGRPELEDAIKSLKKDKSAGNDLILNDFLLNATDRAKIVILLLFNNILTLEYFPNSWALGCIVPIFKSGDKNNTNNYRGITILSCLGKLFTKIMNRRLTKWAEECNILDETQFGFRKSRSTVDCIFIIQGLVQLLIAQGKRLYCCFIDYEKAFDYLDRTAMWTKLIKEGSSSKSIRLLKNMYSKIRLGVRGDGRTFDSHLGLLQGESTSPILFSLFVNDLEGELTSNSIGTRAMDLLIKLIKFADDMAIFSETREGLQAGLDNLSDYCKKWGISVNIPKTKIVVFRKGGRLGQEDRWTFNGTFLEVVSAFKYLGVWLGTTGSFTKCFKELKNSGNRALFQLRTYFAKNPEILPSVQLKLFNSMVLPILFYGSEVWGLCQADPIETFYLSFLKTVLRVKTSTTNIYVYGELGVFPLYVVRQVRVLKYWAKIVNGHFKEDSLVYKVYQALLELSRAQPAAVTWVTMVKDLLIKCGLDDYWNQQKVECNGCFERIVELKVYGGYKRKWREDVVASTDGRIYRYIKNDFRFEKYLEISDSRLRHAISKIRLSSHLFYIERGRWSRPQIDRVNRVCDVCGVLEDEKHCLLECPKYVNERRGRVPGWLSEDPTWENFVTFFKCENELEIRMLGLLCKSVQAAHRKEL